MSQSYTSTYRLIEDLNICRIFDLLSCALEQTSARRRNNYGFGGFVFVYDLFRFSFLCTKKGNVNLLRTKSRKEKTFVLSDILVYCCWMLPLSLRYAPSHAWRLVSVPVCSPVRAFVCVCVCAAALWPEHLGLSFGFSEDGNEYNCLFLFESFPEEKAVVFFFNAPRLLLHVCFIWSVCALHEVHPTFEARRFLHIRFCIQPPTTDHSPARFSHTLCFTQLISALLRELISRALIPVRPLAGCVNVPCGPLSAPID